MELYGSNAKFGAERVDLTEQRYVIGPSGEGKPFPLGTADLLQVLTQRKDGSWRTTYAFPLSEEDGDPIPSEEEQPTADEAAEEQLVADAAEQVEGEEPADAAEPDVAEDEPAVETAACVEPAEQSEPCEEADSEPEAAVEPAADEQAAEEQLAEEGVEPAEDGTDEPVAETTDAEPVAKTTYEALCEAVEVVNLYLQQAFDVSHRRFGSVAGVQVEVPPFGSGYTRVEMVPLDAHGEPSPTPLHLHVETGDNPGGPYSFSAMIEYDAEGNPAHVTMNEYGDEYYQCKVNVTINEKTGRLSVQKIEETVGPNRERRLVYKRAWTPRDGGGRGYRRDDRDGGWGGRDDRRGPRDFDRRDDRRGGRFDDRGPRRDYDRGGRDDYRGGRDRYDDRRGFDRRDDRRDYDRGPRRDYDDRRDFGRGDRDFRRDYDRRDRDYDRRGGRFDDRGPRRDYDRGGRDDYRGGRDRYDDRGGRDFRRDDRGPRSYDRRDDRRPGDRGGRFDDRRDSRAGHDRARYNGRGEGEEFAPTGRRRYDDSQFAGPRREHDHYEAHYGTRPERGGADSGSSDEQ